jgi:hypothetical protein
MTLSFLERPQDKLLREINDKLLEYVGSLKEAQPLLELIVEYGNACEKYWVAKERVSR